MARERTSGELVREAAYEQFKQLIDLTELDDDLRREFRHQASGLLRGKATIRETGKSSSWYGISYFNSPGDVVEFARSRQHRHRFDAQAIIFELISDMHRERLPENEAEAVLQLEVTSSRLFNLRSEAQHGTTERLRAIHEDTQYGLMQAFREHAGNHVSLRDTALDIDYESIINAQAELIGSCPVDMLTVTLQKAWYDRFRQRGRPNKNGGRMFGQVVSSPILTLRLAELVNGNAVLEIGHASGYYQQEFTPTIEPEFLSLDRVDSIFQAVDFLATFQRTDILT